MLEGQAPRVQRVPLELDRPEDLWPVGVPRFAHERVPTQARLDADLISAPALQPDFDERGVLEPLDHSVVADRFLRVGIARMRRLLDQRLLVPGQVIAPLTDAGDGCP